MAKYSKGFERDWQFYLDNKDKFTFSGTAKPDVKYQENSVDAKQAFKVLDSTGVKLPTHEVELLADVLQAKKAINFYIKQCGDGFLDMCEPIETYMKEFINPPDWVGVALRGQIDIKLYGGAINRNGAYLTEDVIKDNERYFAV